MPLLLLFIAIPLIEIALFVQIGTVVGLGWVLVSVVVTAVLGTWLVKRQGRNALARLQGAFSDLRDPSEDLAHGAMILFSGALLLTPGYFTDALGFALLVPRFRDFVWRWLRKRASIQTFSTGHHPPPPPQDDVVEAEYHEITDSAPDTGKPSGWTQH